MRKIGILVTFMFVFSVLSAQPATQPSWEAFAKTGEVKIEQHHLDFADLMCEIINKCEDALFGQLLQDMFENEARDTQLRRVYDKTYVA